MVEKMVPPMALPKEHMMVSKMDRLMDFPMVQMMVQHLENVTASQRECLTAFQLGKMMVSL